MTRKLHLNTLNQRFQKAQPEEIIRWAIEEFRPRIVLTSSFQTESVALLHMVSEIDPNQPILFFETGFHFLYTLYF